MSAAGAVYEAARAAHDAGLCVVPPKEDGTKAPDIDSWTAYQKTRSTQDEIDAWYANGHRSGLGNITGAVSGNQEVIDFDCLATYHDFIEAARAAGLGDLIEQIEAGDLQETPGGGRHWSYRCDEIAGNAKLARRMKRPEEMRDEHDTVATLIETKGEGGFIIIPPSNGRVHPSGRPYRQLRGGVDSIARITPAERAELRALARSFDAMPKAPPRETREESAASGSRPGDDYNRRGDVAALLEAHGWTLVYERNGVAHWRRPGKDRGISATFGYGETRYFYPFTSSTVFEPERAHSPFAVYAKLEHGDDFTAAAEALAQGYGAPKTTIHRSAMVGQATIAAPAFPIDVFPERVRVYVEAAARSLSVPPEMVGVPLLGLAGALIGDRSSSSSRTVGASTRRCTSPSWPGRDRPSRHRSTTPNGRSTPCREPRTIGTPSASRTTKTSAKPGRASARNLASRSRRNRGSGITSLPIDRRGSGRHVGRRTGRCRHP